MERLFVQTPAGQHQKVKSFFKSSTASKATRSLKENRLLCFARNTECVNMQVRMGKNSSCHVTAEANGDKS